MVWSIKREKEVEMFDFLFITSPTNARNPHPPYYFLYLAAYLIKRGLKVKIIDVKGGDRPHEIEQHFSTIANLLGQKENLSNFVGLAAFHSDYSTIMHLGKIVKQQQPQTTLLVGNAHSTINPEDFLFRDSPFDIAVLGEGEETCWNLYSVIKKIKGNLYELQKVSGISYYHDIQVNSLVKTEPREFMNLEDLPIPAYDLIDMNYYLRPQKLIIRRIYTSMICIFAGRGCPYNCLRGDTLIDTTKGKKPIKDLVGTFPKVLTRDSNTKKPVYITPSGIFKTQENAKLVRVHFTDGSHIDCTPDHRFMALQYANQYQPRKEWEVEARNLKKGQSVVACKYPGELVESRAMMERIVGRKLKVKEEVHHIDGDKTNNSASNLILCKNHKEHLNIAHPEFSKKWKGKNNPIHKLSFKERSEKSKKTNLGKKRTNEQKERYSESKRGDKNPNYGKPAWNKGLKGVKVAWNKGLTKETDERVANYGIKHSKTNDEKRKISIRNHKVAYVEKLSFKEDVYCMEIPGYDWFFANDILVHNCDFCAANVVWKANKGKACRLRPVENVAQEIEYLKKKYNIDFFYLFDDMFGMSKKWMESWFWRKSADFVHDYNRSDKPYFSNYNIIKDIPYACQTRADIATEEMIRGLKDTGCIQIDIGVESGSQRLLDNVNKKITLDQIRQVFEWCRKYKIRSFATMLLNLPGETREDLEQTYKFLKEIKPTAGMIFGVTTPYPGTKIYNDYSVNLKKEEYSSLINNRLNPIERFRMAEHNIDLERLWDKWNRHFKATPIFETMWCFIPFQKMYWATVFRSSRLKSYMKAMVIDIFKTFLLYWLHRLRIYRLVKRIQYRGKGY